MNSELHQEIEDLLRGFRGVDLFTVAVALSFTWTKHAELNHSFLDPAVEYLKTGKKTPLRKAARYALRFGPEKLTAGLQGWKTIIDWLPGDDVEAMDAPALYSFQLSCLHFATELVQAGEIKGVGPWLFCAPFKIVLIHRRNLWRGRPMDSLLMPLGLEVNRGIHRLIRFDAEFAKRRGIYPAMLSEEEGGLVEGMGTVYLIQHMSGEMAEAAGTRVMHINSGLYLYGKRELD